MEPKPAPAAHGDGAPAEAPRRRGGGGKRKASGSSFTPSKRHAKERNAAFHAPSHMLHSGPLTRAARQSPHKLSTAPADATPAAAVPGGSGPGEGAAIRADEVQTPAEETPLVDEGFEAVRSRGTGVHVVPTFAGWFSWKEIHQVEKQTLPSFFNGKSEKRTPEIYSGIRNSILMKFHANPQLQLEPKDLAELSLGEVDVRQEVFDFLDHWGLINFHPFPPADLEESKPEESQSDSLNEEKASLIEKLFKFEPIQSYMIPLPNKGDVEIPVPLPSLLPDPVLVEDVIAAAEPSVEYHCNSCSVDCSGKRYHCRTQADFDLCSNCYNEEKFDPGMSKTDFILMDSTEVSGARGTSWTDEETLLLLEALEIFGGKWTEIAEHVATKTKTQCMLHFLQMQIEDHFHDGDDIHQNIQENTEQALAEKGTPEVPEKMEIEEKVEGKDTEDEKPSEKTEGNHTEEKTEEGSVVENKDAKNSGGADSVTTPNVDDPKPSSDTDLAKENSVNLDTSDKSENTQCVIGNGAVVHLPGFFKEIDGLESNGVSCKGRILVSDRAHLLFDFHQVVDGLREVELGNSFIGTTKRGIGPCYSNKVIRNGLRVSDLRHMDTFGAKLNTLLKDAAMRFKGFEYSSKTLKEEVEKYEKFAERLGPYITDTVHFMNESILQKKKILVEGGQATMLDIDFGTYPFVTSSSPSAGGICTGLGIAPRTLGDIIGVVKAYTTRVGSGPFPTELLGKTGDLLRASGMEFGTTTGRPRRCGWLDIVALRYCCQINGFSSLNLTKLDVLTGLKEIKLGTSYCTEDGKAIESFPADLDILEQTKVKYEALPGWEEDISSVRDYDDLPETARLYVERIEELVGIPVHYIGVGPGRDALIYK